MKLISSLETQKSRVRGDSKKRGDTPRSLAMITTHPLSIRNQLENRFATLVVFPTPTFSVDFNRSAAEWVPLVVNPLSVYFPVCLLSLSVIRIRTVFSASQSLKVILETPKRLILRLALYAEVFVLFLFDIAGLAFYAKGVSDNLGNRLEFFIATLGAVEDGHCE